MPAEALIAVVLPALFLATGVVFPIELAFALRPVIQIFLPPMLLAIAAIGYLVDRRVARARGSRFVAMLREALLLLLAAILLGWLLLALSNGKEAGGISLARAASTLDFWVWLLVLATEWLFSAAIYGALDRRARFHESVERWGRGDPAAAYRSFADEAGEALSATRRIRRIVGFFALWSVAMLVVVEWILGRRFAGWEELLLGGALLLELAVMKPLEAWEEEQTLMGEGISLGPSERLLGNASAFLLAVPCLAGAVLLAVAPALLPDSLIAAFFHWLGSLFNHPVRAIAPPPPPPAPPPLRMQPEVLRRLAGGPPPSPSLLLQEILRLIGRALLVLLALAVIWFLIRPLFRAREGRTRAPLELLAAFFRRLRALLREFRQWLESFGAAVQAAGSVEGVTGLRAIVAAAGQLRKKRAATPAANLRRFVRSFFKLVRWAEGKGVPFTTSIAPLEYARLIGARVPGAGREAEAIALLFERNLYSGVPLSGEALSAYYEGIRTVMKK